MVTSGLLIGTESRSSMKAAVSFGRSAPPLAALGRVNSKPPQSIAIGPGKHRLGRRHRKQSGPRVQRKRRIRHAVRHAWFGERPAQFAKGHRHRRSRAASGLSMGPTTASKSSTRTADTSPNSAQKGTGNRFSSCLATTPASSPTARGNIWVTDSGNGRIQKWLALLL